MQLYLVPLASSKAEELCSNKKVGNPNHSRFTDQYPLWCLTPSHSIYVCWWCGILYGYLFLCWMGFNFLFLEINTKTNLKINGLLVAFHPCIFLLNDFQHHHLLKQKVFLANLLTAATLLMAKNWKSPWVPSLEEWLAKIRYNFWYANCPQWTHSDWVIWKLG